MSTHQTCTKCKDCKPLAAFHFIKRADAHDKRCRDCVNAYIKQRRQAADTGPAMRAASTALQRKRKLANPSLGTWAVKTPEQRAKAVECVARWRARHAGRFDEENRLSIQLRHSAAFAKAWPLIVHHYGGKCLGCGSTARLCFDHVRPLSSGGANLITNGQPLCRKCNTFKGHTVSDMDHRPDQGAWIAELAKLNPWLVEPMPAGRWHLLPGGEERRLRLKAESEREMALPEKGGQWAQRRSGFPSPDVAGGETAGQKAQSRHLASLLANLPHN